MTIAERALPLGFRSPKADITCPTNIIVETNKPTAIPGSEGEIGNGSMDLLQINPEEIPLSEVRQIKIIGSRAPDGNIAEYHENVHGTFITELEGVPLRSLSNGQEVII